MSWPKIIDSIVPAVPMCRISPPPRPPLPDLKITSIRVRIELPSEVVEKAMADGPTLHDKVRAVIDKAIRRDFDDWASHAANLWCEIDTAKAELAHLVGREEAEKVERDATEKAPTQARVSNHNFVVNALRARRAAVLEGTR